MKKEYKITKENLTQSFNITESAKPTDFSNVQFENIVFHAVYDAGHHIDDVLCATWSELYEMKSLKEIGDAINRDNDDLCKAVNFNITMPSLKEWFENVVNDSSITAINKMPIGEFVNTHFQIIAKRMVKFYKEFWTPEDNIVGDEFHKVVEEVVWLKKLK